MRLLLYQPNHTGHHYAYLARMMPGIIQLPVEVVLATTQAGIKSEEFQLTLKPFQEHLRIETCCTPPPKAVWRNASHRLRQLIEAVQHIDPDHVYVLYADGIWQLLAIRSMVGRWPFCRQGVDLTVEAWLYRGGFTYPEATRPLARLKRMLFRQVIRRGRIAVLHLDDELMFDFARHCQEENDIRLVLTPNPVECYPPMPKEEARRHLGLDVSRRIVCSIGMVAHWKGMDLLAKAFALYLRNNTADNVQLVLAGPHSDAMNQLLKEEPYQELIEEGHIVHVDRYLSAQEMFQYAAAADVIIASSPRHSGRSSIILWGAAAGRRSLGTAWGCIGHVIREHRLGMTCNVLDTDEFAAGLGEALATPWTAADAKRVRNYAQFHSVENYQQIATMLLREGLIR